MGVRMPLGQFRADYGVNAFSYIRDNLPIIPANSEFSYLRIVPTRINAEASRRTGYRTMVRIIHNEITMT